MVSRRLLAAMSATIVMMALLEAPAAIGATAQIQVSPAQPVPGERVTVRGTGFCPAPCSLVTVMVDGSVAAGNVAIAADGTFEVAVGLTPVAGTSTIVASQTDDSGAVREASAVVRVVASDLRSTAPTAPPAEARDTGQGGGPAAWWIALILLVIVVLAGAAWRLRRSQD